MNSKEAEDFECPICMQVLHKPIRTQCQHVFCQECHVQNFNMNNGKCPLCRNPTSSMERPATDIETWMRTMKANCRGCDIEMYLINMRAHTTTCAKYLEEYGPNYNTSALPQPTPASFSAMEPNRSTFTCPYCQQMGYDMNDLVLHCCTDHYHDYQHVVCPICASMPWGDPNYHSRNFIQHLRVRHQFQYQYFVNFNQDEELMLQDTMWNSYQDFY
ncbi:E3 ubiquitin-protein ligase RNF138-like [Rhincodon typus]|uniref:E3 ubiquitin-protein ligase RNF138-like n=1 Tax=Rhincodon typus TaxID=259920 RepID=UPI0009A327AF|nr:E3 ubiquitin-protein ligase RNF138-like [Rhincodon typus]